MPAISVMMEYEEQSGRSTAQAELAYHQAAMQALAERSEHAYTCAQHTVLPPAAYNTPVAQEHQQMLWPRPFE
jgi:hypothetical protein